MTIGGLQKVTLIDFPGKIACTVFLAGCNFKCPWCYSRELVLPEEIKKQPQISKKEFFDFLKQRKGLLEGVVICGGEPTINKDLPDFVKKIKELSSSRGAKLLAGSLALFKYSLKLDTNGSNPKMLKELIDKKLIDYVAMDIKLPKKRYSELYPKVENIEKSIKILKENKINYEFRSTVVPNVLDKEDIIKIAQWIGGPKVKYYLQNFRPEKTIDPKFEKIKPYPQKYLLEIQKAISPFFEICQIR